MPPRASRKRRYGEITSDLLLDADEVVITNTFIGPGRFDTRKIKQRTSLLRTNVLLTNPIPSSPAPTPIDAFPELPPDEMSNQGFAEDEDVDDGDDDWYKNRGKNESRVSIIDY